MRTRNDELPNTGLDLERLQHREFQDYAAAARSAGLSALGVPTAFVGNAHDPELIAQQLANAWMVQLFDASALLPGNLKDKVLGFQEEVMTFAKHYIKEGMRNETRRIGLLLEGHGYSQAASLVKATGI